VAPGNSTIKVVIDPDGLIVDMDRSNNIAERRISIPLPDLSVASSDVKFSGGVPPAGSATTVSVTVHNPGAGNAANVQVELFCDNVSLGIQNISSIDGKGGSGTAKFPWTATTGEHDFTVKVDGDNALPETAESNNVAGRQISVSNGGGGGFIPGFGACILLAAALALVLSRYGLAGRRA